jgi:hypothetical protein
VLKIASLPDRRASPDETGWRPPLAASALDFYIYARKLDGAAPAPAKAPEVVEVLIVDEEQEAEHANAD